MSHCLSTALAVKEQAKSFLKRYFRRTRGQKKPLPLLRVLFFDSFHWNVNYNAWIRMLFLIPHVMDWQNIMWQCITIYNSAAEWVLLIGVGDLDKIFHHAKCNFIFNINIYHDIIHLEIQLSKHRNKIRFDNCFSLFDCHNDSFQACMHVSTVPEIYCIWTYKNVFNQQISSGDSSEYTFSF